MSKEAMRAEAASDIVCRVGSAVTSRRTRKRGVCNEQSGPPLPFNQIALTRVLTWYATRGSLDQSEMRIA